MQCIINKHTFIRLTASHTHTHDTDHVRVISGAPPQTEQMFAAEHSHFGTTKTTTCVCVFQGSEHKRLYMTNMPLVIAYSFKGAVLPVHGTGNVLLDFSGKF